MNAFYDGRFDVLLSTTIVESGLDIPAANTLIVERADMFGLAQLYQIRGRVGRSKLRAYAFFMTEPRKKLTPQAEKRLRVLGALDSLGAGFTLASQDLDIRGAGNLLGEEQSGQVREVGFELYQEMLQEAIAKLRSGEIEMADEGEWSPQINLGVPVLIPEAYVPDLDVRLGLYRRLSALERKVEMEGFAAELIDRFGPLPAEVDTLLLVVRIKALCKRAGIARLDGGPKGATVQFHNDKYANPAGLVQFLNDQQRRRPRSRTTGSSIRRDWASEKARLAGAFAIARDLAGAGEAAGGGGAHAPDQPRRRTASAMSAAVEADVAQQVVVEPEQLPLGEGVRPPALQAAVPALDERQARRRAPAREVGGGGAGHHRAPFQRCRQGSAGR